MNIDFEKLSIINIDYEQIQKWCSNKFVYEWFEQRILSLEEITNKYRNKLNDGKQDLFIIKCNEKNIGLVQIYKFENDINLKEFDQFNNIYEYDLFIGEEEYLSKGIGTIVVKKINDMIYDKYNADAIILRPFKRNNRAIKCYEKCDYKNVNEYDGRDTLGNPEVISVLLNTKNTNY